MNFFPFCNVIHLGMVNLIPKRRFIFGFGIIFLKARFVIQLFKKRNWDPFIKTRTRKKGGALKNSYHLNYYE